MEGEGEPAEIQRLRREVGLLADDLEQTNVWLTGAMAQAWEMAGGLAACPALADLLGERHRIVANDWQSAGLQGSGRAAAATRTRPAGPRRLRSSGSPRRPGRSADGAVLSLFGLRAAGPCGGSHGRVGHAGARQRATLARLPRPGSRVAVGVGRVLAARSGQRDDGDGAGLWWITAWATWPRCGPRGTFRLRRPTMTSCAVCDASTSWYAGEPTTGLASTSTPAYRVRQGSSRSSRPPSTWLPSSSPIPGSMMAA